MKILVGKDGSLRVPEDKVDGFIFTEYVKRPIPIQAVQINEEFEVETLEGVMKGNAGDFLIIGIKGEPYPCKKEIFEESYMPFRDADIDVDVK